jgi:hypothetical protein
MQAFDQIARSEVKGRPLAEALRCLVRLDCGEAKTIKQLKSAKLPALSEGTDN